MSYTQLLIRNNEHTSRLCVHVIIFSREIFCQGIVGFFLMKNETFIHCIVPL